MNYHSKQLQYLKGIVTVKFSSTEGGATHNLTLTKQSLKNMIEVLTEKIYNNEIKLED